MSNIIWSVVTILSFLAYIGINLWWYKCYELKKEKLSRKIIFWILRIVIILFLLAFMFFSFNEYVFFCKRKMFYFFMILVAIILVEFFYPYVVGDGGDGYALILFLITILVIAAFTIVVDEFCDFSSGDIKYIDNKVVTVKVITASDRHSVPGEIDDSFFGIHGYISNGEMKYSYYYYHISDDGKKAIYDEFKESQLEDGINIIEEGRDAYIKITTKQYINQEEKTQKIHDGEATYTIYAPISAFLGVSFDVE